MGQRNPAPVENGGFNPLFIGFQPKVVQDFATIRRII